MDATHFQKPRNKQVVQNQPMYNDAPSQNAEENVELVADAYYDNDMQVGTGHLQNAPQNGTVVTR